MRKFLFPVIGLLVAILVPIIVVVVLAQDGNPEVKRAGVAAGGGERTSADESIKLTDVIGLAAVGHSTSGTSNLELFAGLVWLGGIPPSVTTGSATGIGPHAATLNATLDDIGSAGTVTVRFDWDSDNVGTYSYHTGNQYMTGTGAFAIPISDLLDNKTYYYRAAALGDGFDYGEEMSFTTPNEPTIIYVNIDASGNDNGTSWADAYTDLQSALFRASEGDELWVAAGTYTPGTERAATFQMKNGVSLYGGFYGTEGTRTERNWQGNKTILSGDIGVFGDNTDNCYHVVSGSAVGGNTTVIDGFIITDGNANGPGDLNAGGGIFLKNGSPVLSNLVFKHNTAEYGGAMYNEASSPTLINCTFWNNAAVILPEGAGISSAQSASPLSSGSLTLEQAMQSDWSAGGAISNYYSNSIIINCAFSGNSADIGGALLNDNSIPILTNCILWNDYAGLSGQELTGAPVVTYSNIQYGTGQPWFGTGCLDADPMWADPENGDFHLYTNSPCIDSGTNQAIQSTGVTQDFEGDSRIIGGTVDMGPDESRAIFVDDSATGENNGGSWVNAYTDLQEALAVSSYGAEIWVAAGTYTPGTDRADSFQMKNGVKIYGGFSGTETAIWQRNWQQNPTILSGDIGVPGNNADNCYHVFYHPGTLTSEAILDGFTITGGMANGNDNHDNGGGIYNSGGSSPLIINCIFADNTSAYKGGGVYNENSSSTITNCIFWGNTSTVRGGGMYNYQSLPVLTNCTFSGNNALSEGGGLYNHDSSPVLTNCILWGDTAGSYSEIRNYGTSSPVVTYCNIQGGYSGTGNIDEDPIWVNPGSQDLHLDGISPCINAGTNSAPNLPDTDFNGNARILLAVVDMGIDEAQAITLTFTSDPNGSVITPGEGDHTCVSYSSVSIAAEANYCYQFDSWTVVSGSASFDDENDISTIMTCSGTDTTIQANFLIRTHNLTMGNDGHGTTTPASGINGPYDCGTQVAINADPDTCYSFAQWTGDTAYLTGPATQASNSVTMPEGDISLTATFTLDQYNLTLADDGHGSVTPYEGSQPFNCGTQVAINADPDTCYSFAQWTGDTAYLTGPATQASNSVTMPEGDISLTATYSLIQYDLTTSSGEGGSVTVPGEGTFGDYDCGTQVPIVAEATACYEFTGWTGDTAMIANPGSPSTTITMNGDYSIQASFQLVCSMVDIYVNLQGGSRPVSGWAVPINVGFYPPGSPDNWLLNPASATYYFTGTTTLSVYGGGTRAYFQCPDPIMPGTYDITVDSSTTLLNVRRSVGIW